MRPTICLSPSSLFDCFIYSKKLASSWMTSKGTISITSMSLADSPSSENPSWKEKFPLVLYNTVKLPSIFIHLVQSQVDPAHVVGDRVNAGSFGFANNVPLGVGWPRCIWFENAHVLERSVHQVDEADAERSEEVKELADKMASGSDCKIGDSKTSV